MKNLTLVCEAAIRLNESAADQGKPKGMIEACATTWGAREGEDGRKFNYQPEGFADWAANFAESNKPLPMFLNHNDNGLPSGEWTEFNLDDAIKDDFIKDVDGLIHVVKNKYTLYTQEEFKKKWKFTGIKQGNRPSFAPIDMMKEIDFEE